MKIAIISDIHENFHNLILALKHIKKFHVKKIIMLGDLINPAIAKVLVASEIPVFAIWGNNDGDKVAITKASLSKGSNLEMGFDTYDFLELGGRKLFLTHYPLLARSMAKSGDFDAVFYGHDHKKNLDRVGNCIIVNPGELSAHKTGKATFAIYDTDSNTAEIIELRKTVSTKTKESEEHLEKMNFTFSKTKTHKY